MDNQKGHTDVTEDNRVMLSKPVTSDKMDWARQLMAAEGLSQKDVARSWEVSESSVSRWLDGLQSTDLSLQRAVKFSRLVRRPLDEIAVRLGYEVWATDGVPRVQPLPSAYGKPPVPTTSLEPGSREGMFFLLLHLELTAANVAAIISTLGKQDETDDKPGNGNGDEIIDNRKRKSL